MIRKITIALFFTFFCMEAYSETIYTECSTCTSEYEKEVIAKHLASDESTSTNEVLVMDPNTWKLSKFRVAHIDSREPGVPPSTLVTPVALSSQEVTLETNIRNFNRDIWSVTVPSNVLQSVWQLPGSQTTQTQFLNWVKANLTVVQTLDAYAGMILSAAGKIVGVKGTLYVYLENGDYLVLTVEGLDPELYPVFEIKDAWDFVSDSSFNKIPFNANELKDLGSYTLRDNELVYFQQVSDRLGVGVAFPGGTGGVGGGGNGGGWHCYPTTTGVACKPL